VSKQRISGTQLFCLRAPIDTGIYPFIALEITKTFAVGPKAHQSPCYMNRIYLYSEEIPTSPIVSNLRASTNLSSSSGSRHLNLLSHQSYANSNSSQTPQTPKTPDNTDISTSQREPFRRVKETLSQEKLSANKVRTSSPSISRVKSVHSSGSSVARSAGQRSAPRESIFIQSTRYLTSPQVSQSDTSRDATEKMLPEKALTGQVDGEFRGTVSAASEQVSESECDDDSLCEQKQQSLSHQIPHDDCDSRVRTETEIRTATRTGTGLELIPIPQGQNEGKSEQTSNVTLESALGFSDNDDDEEEEEEEAEGESGEEIKEVDGVATRSPGSTTRKSIPPSVNPATSVATSCTSKPKAAICTSTTAPATTPLTSASGEVMQHATIQSFLELSDRDNCSNGSEGVNETIVRLMRLEARVEALTNVLSVNSLDMNAVGASPQATATNTSTAAASGIGTATNTGNVTGTSTTNGVNPELSTTSLLSARRDNRREIAIANAAVRGESHVHQRSNRRRSPSVSVTDARSSEMKSPAERQHAGDRGNNDDDDGDDDSVIENKRETAVVSASVLTTVSSIVSATGASASTASVTGTGTGNILADEVNCVHVGSIDHHHHRPQQQQHEELSAVPPTTPSPFTSSASASGTALSANSPTSSASSSSTSSSSLSSSFPSHTHTGTYAQSRTRSSTNTFEQPLTQAHTQQQEVYHYQYQYEQQQQQKQQQKQRQRSRSDKNSSSLRHSLVSEARSKGDRYSYSSASPETRHIKKHATPDRSYGGVNMHNNREGSSKMTRDSSSVEKDTGATHDAAGVASNCDNNSIHGNGRSRRRRNSDKSVSKRRRSVKGTNILEIDFDVDTSEVSAIVHLLQKKLRQRIKLQLELQLQLLAMRR
jgi:hypothetical protein